MFKRILFIASTVGMLSIISCDQELKYETTETGLQYCFIVEGDGPKPQEGEILILSMVYSDENGNELLNTVSDGDPLPIAYVEAALSDNGSLEEMFKKIKKGDSINFKVNAKKVFEETFKIPLPDSIRAESLLTFEMGVEEVLDRSEYNNWQGQNRVRQNIRDLDKEQMELDGSRIDQYLAKNDIEAEITANGVRYVIVEQGKGEKAAAGQYVKVDYTGRVLEGGFFDSSVREVAQEHGLYDERREPYEPYAFTLGWGEVILGWDLGISQLNKGGKAQLYIPSPMAYGNQQVSEVITANAILVFDVELVDVAESN